MYFLVIIVCAFACVVGYFIGLSVTEQNEDLLREMFPDISAEVYEDHESAETTIFITLVEKPAYSVKKVIVNDCEYLTLFQEAREI